MPVRFGAPLRRDDDLAALDGIGERRIRRVEDEAPVNFPVRLELADLAGAVEGALERRLEEVRLEFNNDFIHEPGARFGEIVSASCCTRCVPLLRGPSL